MGGLVTWGLVTWGLVTWGVVSMGASEHGGWCRDLEFLYRVSRPRTGPPNGPRTAHTSPLSPAGGSGVRADTRGEAGAGLGVKRNAATDMNVSAAFSPRTSTSGSASANDGLRREPGHQILPPTPDGPSTQQHTAVLRLSGTDPRVPSGSGAELRAAVKKGSTAASASVDPIPRLLLQGRRPRPLRAALA